MANFARYELRFNLDDEVDRAIYEMLAQLAVHRRAASFVRESLAARLTGQRTPEPAPLPRAKREIVLDQVAAPAPVDYHADELAADSFLNMFG